MATAYDNYIEGNCGFDAAAQAADEQLCEDFDSAPDSVRAELYAEWIEANRDRDEAFFDFLRENRERVVSTDYVDDAIRLIRRALPWVKASESVHSDLERAVKILRGEA